MKNIFRKIVSIVVLASVLIMSFAPASAVIDEKQIETLYFECNGSTIKTAYDVPINEYKNHDGVRFGYVDLAAAFGEGAEDWYAVGIRNTEVESGDIGKYLNEANRVFYFVTLKSTDSISLRATVTLYPRGIMPGENTIQMFDSETGEPKKFEDGSNETVFSWGLGDIKNDTINIERYLGESAKAGVSKVEVWYNGSCKYTFSNLNIIAAYLYENGNRGLVKVYAIEGYKVKPFISSGMSNGIYLKVNGQPWASTKETNSFKVEYIPKNKEINLLDYFSDGIRSAIINEINALENNGVYYETYLELEGVHNQNGFIIDSSKLVEWMEKNTTHFMNVSISSQMSEELFNERYKVTSETASYTGKPLGVSYSLGHPMYRVSIVYDTDDGNEPINIGNYHYTMTPTHTAYIPFVREGYFTITKAIPSEGIPFENQRVLYDGKVKDIDVGYLGLSDAKIVYENTNTGNKTSKPTDIGMYNAYIDIADNANIENGTLILKNALQICENIIKHSITVNNGSADFSKEIKGEKITVTAREPEKGKLFDHWESNLPGVVFEDSQSSKTTFLMPDDDVTITAVYRDILYSITVEGGSIENDSAKAGSVLTITADTVDGKVFNGWTLVSGNAVITAPLQSTTTVEVGYSDCVIRSNYVDKPVRQEAHHIFILEGKAASSARAGEIVTITYSPSGSRLGRTVFKRWVCKRGNVVFENANSETTTFIMPNEEVEIVAEIGIAPPQRFVATALTNANVYIIIGAVVVIAGAVFFVIRRKKK